jgi:hypothetical protein
MVLQLDGKPFAVVVGFLLIRIHMVRPVLGKGVEMPRVVEHGVVHLLEIQELLQLAAEQTR